MSKLLWVALPLLIAATLLALQALLQRRAPSRHALNIWSSLLLTGYVSTTAGLGIFWMANQQLPPFDWHYLFGYTTVLLVALHLAFNFPIAWRYLTRPPGAAPAALASDHQHAASARRRWLSTLGLLLTAGTAFVLGMRHGRSDFRVEWPMPGGGGSSSPGSGPAALADRSAALELVERYHAFSTHTRVGVLLRAPSVDWGDPPPPFKHYPDAPRVALLRFAPFALAAADSAPFGLQALATVLWHTAAVTDARGPVKLRASPSSGALFSTELYVVARAVAGLPPGLWHYDAKAHALERRVQSTWPPRCAPPRRPPRRRPPQRHPPLQCRNSLPAGLRVHSRCRPPPPPRVAPMCWPSSPLDARCAALRRRRFLSMPWPACSRA